MSIPDRWKEAHVQLRSDVSPASTTKQALGAARAAVLVFLSRLLLFPSLGKLVAKQSSLSLSPRGLFRGFVLMVSVLFFSLMAAAALQNVNVSKVATFIRADR